MPQKTAWDTIGKVQIMPEPDLVKESAGWWYAEAQKAFGRKCPKCGNECTQGLYIPPHSLSGECAVVNNCLICGNEEVIRRGKNHAPIDTAKIFELPRMTERPVKLIGNSVERKTPNHHKKSREGYTYGA